MAKDTFLVYKDWEMLIENMTDSQVGHIFKGLFAIQNGKDYQFSPETSGIANFFIDKILKNEERYRETCRKRSESAKMTKASKSKQMQAKVSKCKQMQANEGDTDTDTEPNTDTDTDTDTESERVINNSNKDKEKKSVLPREEKFSIPTLDEVKDYFYNHMDFEINYNEPINFYSYNQARQWQGVRDWHPLADMWHRKFKESQKTNDEDVINDVYSKFKAMYKGGDSDE